MNDIEADTVTMRNLWLKNYLCNAFRRNSKGLDHRGLAQNPLF